MTDMASDKMVETVIVGNYVEMETEGKPRDVKTKISNFFWHGGSVYDAWFSCASNQVRTLHFLSQKELPITAFFFLFLFQFANDFSFLCSVNSFFVSGGSSSAYLAVLIFPAGNAIRHTFSALLRVDGKLDSISH